MDWSHIPFDDVGYVSSQEFLTWPDEAVRQFIQTFERNRYGGARNWHDLWRSTLGLDSTHEKKVHDYGCGFGIEALQFCRSGNSVHVSDIFQSNIQAAERVLRLSGYEPMRKCKVDIFYSNGVLHHSKKIREVLKEAVENLNPGGEIRLLLYSDKAWTWATGMPLPAIEDDVSKHPAFERYVRMMDEAGDYADWYNQEKLEHRVGDFLKVEKFNYIMQNGMYATVILKPHG
jgi:SAM-dependent methyltransferase